MTSRLLHSSLSRALRAALPLVATAVAAIGNDQIAPSYLPGNADTLQLEAVKVSGGAAEASYTVQRSQAATKTDTALVNIPQAITVVTRELIDDQAMQGIADLTRYVPGAGIAQGEGNRDTPVLRGNSTTADFYLDGTRDDVQYFRDLYNVDHVEVLKGPNAMIFGRGGTGGLINRITKQARGRTLREITLQAGSWDQFRSTLDVGQAINADSSVRVAALYEDSGSYRDSVKVRRQGINPTVSWNLGPRTTLRAGYEYFHDERTADRGVSSFHGRPLDVDPSTFFGDPDRSHARVSVDSAFALLEHRLARGGSIRNQTRVSRYDKFYQNVFPGAVAANGTDVAISAYNNATQRDNFFNQTDVVLPWEAAGLKHQWLLGAEFGRQHTENLRNTGYFTSVSPTTTSVLVPIANPRTTLPITFRPSATDADNAGTAQTYAAYVQDQVEILPGLNAIAGVRFERFTVDFHNNRTASDIDSADNLVSPRFGLIYKPADSVSVYVSSSTAYTPRAGEQLSSLTATNRAFDPEEFRNLEAGVKWDVRPDLALSLAAYQLDRSNVVITDPTDSTKSILVDGQRAKGVEFGLTGRFSSRWSVAGGYAYQDGRIKTTQSATVVAGARLAQLPRHSLSLWNRYELSSRWGAGLGVVYRDAIFASTDNTVRVPGFVRVDAAVFLRLNRHWRAQVNVENVLDRHYFSAANSNTNITPGSPRAVRLGVTTSY
jgi:catecholate siderophore receptor